MPVLPDYDSPIALKKLLEDRGMAMQKKFGQNFMVNRAQREKLVDALSLTEGMSVWEIGPGLGSMTSSILDRGAALVAFEIDRGFCGVLRDIFAERQNFTLIEGDVLKNWKKAVDERGIPARLFGNLPYNIAAVIIGDMIGEGVRYDSVVITVQKEVALRMAAKPGTEDYSSFSALCQWAYEVTPIMDLAGGSFWPRPNVGSRAVKMTKRADWPRCESPKAFMAVLRALFSSRRKTAKNNLSAYVSQNYAAVLHERGLSADELATSLLSDANIAPEARAETLGVEDFLRLADRVARL